MTGGMTIDVLVRGGCTTIVRVDGDTLHDQIGSKWCRRTGRLIGASRWCQVSLDCGDLSQVEQAVENTA